jgi:hypothetical protein
MMARGAVRKAVRCGAVVSVSAVAGGWKVAAENKDTSKKIARIQKVKDNKRKTEAKIVFHIIIII